MPSSGVGTYRVITLPSISPIILKSYEDLPIDRYAQGPHRFRRFSAYRVVPTGSRSWRLELLPHRPLIQSREVNSLVGGVYRHFDPLHIDPTPIVSASAEALKLDRSEPWHVNVHQWRVITDSQISGFSVPEGPHRDGHAFTMIAVLSRHNITGGETQLMPIGGGIPFFRAVLEPGQALIFDDADMWHYATDIVSLDGSLGYRDVMIAAYNPWASRKYGDSYERSAAPE